jgi:hypothetical protein
LIKASKGISHYPTLSGFMHFSLPNAIWFYAFLTTQRYLVLCISHYPTLSGFMHFSLPNAIWFFAFLTNQRYLVLCISHYPTLSGFMHLSLPNAIWFYASLTTQRYLVLSSCVLTPIDSLLPEMREPQHTVLHFCQGPLSKHDVTVSTF